MNNKRKAGERSGIRFDNIDCQIAAILLKEQPLAILEFVDKLNIKHANLKNHLDRMERFGLIRREPVPKSRKVLIYLNEKIYTKERIKMLLKMLGWDKK